MIYEYDCQDIGLSDEEKQMVEIGIAKIDVLNTKIKDIINIRAKGGWEPLYPFSVPMLWFKKAKNNRQKI